MIDYEFEDPGPLEAPALVVAFEGWVSAGSAGTATARVIAGDGPIVAVFNGDALFDYRANRPVVDFREGVMAEVSWPEMALHHRVLDGRDVLVLVGNEPNWNWRRFADSVVALGRRLGVVEQISLGGIPWAAPHTRPVSVVMTASDAARIDRSEDHPQGLLRVPGAAVSIVEHHMIEAGIPTVGFWARVPHYVGAEYFGAVVALVERVGRHLGISIPLGSLVDDAAAQRRQLDELVAERPEVRSIVEQLEAMADQAGAISGEDLAGEIERFLRQQSSGEGGLGDDGP